MRNPLTLTIRRLAALGGVVLVLGAAVGVGTYAAVDRGEASTTSTATAAPAAQPAANTSGSDLTVNEIYRRAASSVVTITVTSTSSSGSGPSPFGGGQEQQSQGSGFVLDSSGHIVTNEHVVDGADSIRVKFSNGATYTATVVGSDPSTDLAVLKVNAPSSLLKPLTLASSSTVEVGDGVVAIGSPFGLEESVTTGIVSGLHREMTSPNNFTIDDSIQTDAAINHGNSGGPLLNMRGQVIGVNAQIQSESGGNDGVGFAIPSDTVRSVTAQLIDDGTVEHAYLGVGIETIPASAADALGEAAGAAVTDVRDGTPAATAGLQAATGSKTVDGQSYPTGGDVVTRVDGKKVVSGDELRAAIDAKQPGDTITLTVVRGGETRTVKVELVARPS